MTSAASLYRNQANIDFRTWWKRGAVLSMMLLLIAGGALIFRGLNLGIEFEGGVSWEFRADDLSTDMVLMFPSHSDRQMGITPLVGSLIRLWAPPPAALDGWLSPRAGSPGTPPAQRQRSHGGAQRADNHRSPPPGQQIRQRTR